MTIEALLAELRRRKMFVSNFYEGTDGIWRCFLRDKRNGQYVTQSRGDTALAALHEALHPTFEDLL